MHKHSAKILIVDDIKPNRLVIKNYLANNDYDILQADSARHAFELLEQDADVDLILLDIIMPEIDGIEVLKRLKASHELHDLPVIMVTAMGAQDALPECLELGASDYVTKPINRHVLQARVSTQLSRKQAMDEVKESRLHLSSKVKERTRELKQTLSQLYQAQKMEAIGVLAGGFAHDFNNVLASIAGHLYFIERDAGDSDKVSHRAKLLEKICMQSSDHIRQLLCFAKKESVQMTAVDMHQCVHSGCEIADVGIPSYIKLEYIHPEEALFVYWNETQIQQVLLNLITNASHALEGVREASIRVELDVFKNRAEFLAAHPDMQDKCYARLSVRDNGSGIPPEEQEKIFTPFYTTKEEGKGTGLGLPMVLGSISNAKGVMEVESNVGSGTAFIMYLPLVAEGN